MNELNDFIFDNLGWIAVVIFGSALVIGVALWIKDELFRPRQSRRTRRRR